MSAKGISDTHESVVVRVFPGTARSSPLIAYFLGIRSASNSEILSKPDDLSLGPALVCGLRVIRLEERTRPPSLPDGSGGGTSIGDLSLRGDFDLDRMSLELAFEMSSAYRARASARSDCPTETTFNSCSASSTISVTALGDDKVILVRKMYVTDAREECMVSPRAHLECGGAVGHAKDTVLCHVV